MLLELLILMLGEEVIEILYIQIALLLQAELLMKIIKELHLLEV
jgi:hypothetical protein